MAAKANLADLHWLIDQASPKKGRGFLRNKASNFSLIAQVVGFTTSHHQPLVRLCCFARPDPRHAGFTTSHHRPLVRLCCFARPDPCLALQALTPASQKFSLEHKTYWRHETPETKVIKVASPRICARLLLRKTWPSLLNESVTFFLQIQYIYLR